MSITVQAHELTPTIGDASLTVDGARTVAEAVGMLRLPLRTAVIILVNGRLASWETPLRDGDLVELLPALSGG